MIRLQQLRELAYLSSLLARAVMRRPQPNSISLQERLKNLPLVGAPLSRPISIRWDNHNVPFVVAETDEDAAVGLGIVHAHLRLSQIEMLRRISHGSVAEIGGQRAVKLDHALRTLDFGRAVPEIIAQTPPETIAWMEAFARGINHVIEHTRLPSEFDILGFKPAHWTVSDILMIGRLAAGDVSWFVLLRFLKSRGIPGWDELWPKLLDDITASNTFITVAASGRAAFEATLSGFPRSGSNAFAVASKKSKNDAPWLVGDSHLSVGLPNLWLLGGFKSPSYHVTGIMIPGLPFVAAGRNMDVAWGGTNLHALSSDMIDVSDLPPSEITTREEILKVRGMPDQILKIGETKYGPILTGTPLLRRNPKQIALKWVGHYPSDEITAMLNVNKARTVDEFHEALESFALPGQNMVAADTSGHILKGMAVHLPRRIKGPKDVISRPEDVSHWDEFVTIKDLPVERDPDCGFVASANDRPAATEIAVGYFFSSSDRVQRIGDLLSATPRLGFDELAPMQRDVYSASSDLLKKYFVILCEKLPARVQKAHRNLLSALKTWDGHYEANSSGALAFELIFAELVAHLHEKSHMSAYETILRLRTLREDLAAAAFDELGGAFQEAVEASERTFQKKKIWGNLHRLQLAHPLGSMPLIGRFFRFADVPVGGSSETLMKTAHKLTSERHATTYGSNARYISDLASVDQNYFLLLGGQDGWLGSTTFLDQLTLWRRGTYIQMPLSLPEIKRLFAHETILVAQ